MPAHTCWRAFTDVLSVLWARDSCACSCWAAAANDAMLRSTSSAAHQKLSKSRVFLGTSQPQRQVAANSKETTANSHRDSAQHTA